MRSFARKGEVSCARIIRQSIGRAGNRHLQTRKIAEEQIAKKVKEINENGTK